MSKYKEGDILESEWETVEFIKYNSISTRFTAKVLVSGDSGYDVGDICVTWACSYNWKLANYSRSPLWKKLEGISPNGDKSDNNKDNK